MWSLVDTVVHGWHGMISYPCDLLPLPMVLRRLHILACFVHVDRRPALGLHFSSHFQDHPLAFLVVSDIKQAFDDGVCQSKPTFLLRVEVVVVIEQFSASSLSVIACLYMVVTTTHYITRAA